MREHASAASRPWAALERDPFPATSSWRWQRVAPRGSHRASRARGARAGLQWQGEARGEQLRAVQRGSLTGCVFVLVHGRCSAFGAGSASIPSSAPNASARRTIWASHAKALNPIRFDLQWGWGIVFATKHGAIRFYQRALTCKGGEGLTGKLGACLPCAICGSSP